MKHQNCRHWVSVSALAVTYFVGVGLSQAQLCFDVFATNDADVLQCSDADYFFDPPGGGFDPEMTNGSDTGITSSSFQGRDIFNSPAEVPSTIEGEFFSSNTFSVVEDAMGVSQLDFAHRGRVSMGPTDSDSQQAAFNNRSRVTFVPVNVTEPNPNLNVSLIFTLTLTDAPGNNTTGAPFAGVGANFIGGNDGVSEFGFQGLIELDLALASEPEVFGFESVSDDVASTFTPNGTGTFDIELEIDTDFPLDSFDLGEEIIVEVDTFGAIFSDGFESGDVSVWTSASPDTMALNLSSNDPNLRFQIIPEPSVSLMAMLGLGLLGRRRRP